ncbi:MAG: hypothetical protein ABWY35_02400 [Pseudorhodoplanes sp.]
MSFAGKDRTLRATAALVAAALLSFAGAARADIVPLVDQLRGLTISQNQCDALPRAVFVAVAGREFCIRYYLSVAGGTGKQPMVFLQGDRLGRLDTRTGEFQPGPRDRDIDTKDFNRIATELSQQAGAPAIYLARPGLDGSSGTHRIRHTTLELLAVNAALEAIKQRHGFIGYHMLGQSGGSTLIGGLLGMRPDLGCVVIGSGLLSYRAARRSSDPARDFFNPADAVAAIAQKRGSRILLVTDPADRKVPERVQTEFGQRLRAAGGQVDQFLVQATDDDRHGVLPYARTAMEGCLRGTPTDLIGSQIGKQVERALAAKVTAEAQKPAQARDVGFPAQAR